HIGRELRWRLEIRGDVVEGWGEIPQCRYQCDWKQHGESEYATPEGACAALVAIDPEVAKTFSRAEKGQSGKTSAQSGKQHQIRCLQCPEAMQKKRHRKQHERKNTKPKRPHCRARLTPLVAKFSHAVSKSI